ncbi:MAG: PKD domain-containing protein [Sphingobacteriales bacterium]|nr:MAG: PKD domain-containing protein [Sphingobacteriales bacterium]
MNIRYSLYLLFTYLLVNTNYAIASPGGKPIEFVQNRGQWQAPFLYKAVTGSGDFLLEKDGFRYIVGDLDNAQKIIQHKTASSKEAITLKYHVYKVVMVGMNEHPIVEATKPQENYYNYFLGTDSMHWKTGIHPNLAVDYKNVYNGVDLHVSSEDEKLKYDFILQPGADAAQIALRYEGTQGLKIKNNKLFVNTSVGPIEEMEPFAYQYINGIRKKVTCRYKLKDSTITYSFPDGYDNKEILIIDPTVIFSRFTGSAFDNWGFTATYDANGNFYAGGITSDYIGGTGYTLVGAFQTTYGGGNANGTIPCDMGITKFNASGTAVIYSTYLGGSGNEQPHSLIVDNSGDLIIAGRSNSTNYPVTGGSTNSGGYDIVVTKFNPAGNSLLGSRYVGGSGDDGVNFDWDEATMGNLKFNYGDDARSEVIIDNGNNIYVTASTKSTNFPTVNASQTTLNGGTGQDAVAFKLDANVNTLAWSTYIGGSADDAGYALALDVSQDHVFVAGGTSSNNFPSPASGTFASTYQGGVADGFICRFLNSATYTHERTTFIGKNNYDQCYGVQVDKQNNVYAMGQTLGGTFPVVKDPAATTVYSNTGGCQFIIKLDADLTTNIFSTVFGNGNHVNISPVAFLVDTCENIYISGWGGTLGIAANNSSSVGLPVTPPLTFPLQTTTDGTDFYFIVLSKYASNLLFGAFYGRSTPTDDRLGEHVDGGTSRFDKNGVIYQAICANCGGNITGAPFPTTVGPASGSSNCNLAALKVQFNFSAVIAGAAAAPDTTICLGNSVQFVNNSSNGTSFEWDFGDGVGTSNLQTPAPYTYTTPGTYTVRLIVINPLVCKDKDTAYLTVTVSDALLTTKFGLAKNPDCSVYEITVSDSSSTSSGGQLSYLWLWGDGTSSTVPNPPPHTYGAAGTYTVMLILTDPLACNSPDTVEKIIGFDNKFVKAGFEVSTACERTEVPFSNKSENGDTYEWDFGDGDTTGHTQVSPVHIYDTAGTYTIRMFAYNPATCNLLDSASTTLVVKPSPTADFVYDPTIPETNKAIKFTNRSRDAILYSWQFGDGEFTDQVSPEHFYKRTGSYTACLTAINDFGCTDTICKNVAADVLPLVDVPTGFTPDGDGKNDIFYVRGAAVEKASLKVYNRFGEKIFEVNNVPANNPAYGWDGSFKGKPQEMETYAFVLSGMFVDGTSFYKKGNIALIR